MWAEAWPRRDVEAIVAVYAANATFSSHPFRGGEEVRAYVEWVFGDQESSECRFGAPVVQDDRAAVDWWGVVTARDGAVETLAGTSLLRFGKDGLVVEQRDVWASAPGRHDLPSWAPA